ncbi:sugar transferase [Peredibacter sp. HCB2-198]|uniref:sugar transferase n=1 Tax=Peredibacter sp. HCB2-198 TaxID=3383025 RepID=UPI0038B59B77
MPRLLNILLAIVGLIILIIPMLLIGLIIKITSPGPAIHRSKRVGINNNIFLMPKFRTMWANTPQLATHLLQDSENYLTSFGSFLRKNSLDELPQLWSVLIGDMNLVGPRPALFNQHDLIEIRTKYRIHTLKPGITGWAQINGRDEISMETKVKFDQEYLEKRSLLFDIKILFITVNKILRKENITH